RLTEGSRSYVDAIHLGRELSRGGLILDQMRGSAVEAVGDGALAKLLPKLTCEQERPLVPVLEQIDKDTVAWQVILDNEKRFNRPVAPILGLLDPWLSRSLRRAVKEQNDFAVVQVRLFTVEFALRCYRSEHSAVRAALEQLVPAYIS